MYVHEIISCERSVSTDTGKIRWCLTGNYWKTGSCGPCATYSTARKYCSCMSSRSPESGQIREEKWHWNEVGFCVLDSGWEMPDIITHEGRLPCLLLPANGNCTEDRISWMLSDLPRGTFDCNSWRRGSDKSHGVQTYSQGPQASRGQTTKHYDWHKNEREAAGGNEDARTGRKQRSSSQMSSRM